MTFKLSHAELLATLDAIASMWCKAVVTKGTTHAQDFAVAAVAWNTGAFLPAQYR